MSEPATPPDLPRLVRFLKITLGVNISMIVINAGVLYALLVFVVGESSDVAGVDPFDQAVPEDPDEKEKADPREEMREFFDRTTDLLDRAARKHGANPADVLPTPDQVNAAIETRTIHSDDSQVVMQKLREGFDYYNIEWPSVVPER